MTEYDHIYQLDNGTYLKYLDSSIVLEVDKIDVDLTNLSSISELENSYALEKEVIDDLKKTQELLNNGEIKLEGAIVFTSAVENSANNLRSQSTRYYNYNGASMKDEEIYYYNRWTGFRDVVTGPDSANIASSIVSVAIDGATYVPYIGNIISILSSGANLASAYQQATGSWPISGGSSDFIQCAVTYDTYRKWSYRYYPTNYNGMQWCLGCVSEKAKVLKIETIQYYANNGGRQPQTTTYPNETFKTPNFDSPGATAYQWVNYAWVENLNYRIPGTNHQVYFN